MEKSTSSRILQFSRNRNVKARHTFQRCSADRIHFAYKISINHPRSLIYLHFQYLLTNSKKITGRRLSGELLQNIYQLLPVFIFWTKDGVSLITAG